MLTFSFTATPVHADPIQHAQPEIDMYLNATPTYQTMTSKPVPEELSTVDKLPLPTVELTPEAKAEDERKRQEAERQKQLEHKLVSLDTPQYSNLPHTYDVNKAIQLAYSEVGTARATGWSAPGECIMSVKRWVTHGGGNWGPGGSPVNNYTTANEVQMKDILPGDVIQYMNSADNHSWGNGVHTVFVTGVNSDGTYRIVESNNPAGSGLVTSNDNWTPMPPAGWVAKAFRF